MIPSAEGHVNIQRFWAFPSGGALQYNAPRPIRSQGLLTFGAQGCVSKDSRSEQQLGDVRNILQNVQQMDYAYMQRWAEHLGVMELYREVAG